MNKLFITFRFIYIFKYVSLHTSHNINKNKNKINPQMVYSWLILFTQVEVMHIILLLCVSLYYFILIFFIFKFIFAWDPREKVGIQRYVIVFICWIIIAHTHIGDSHNTVSVRLMMVLIRCGLFYPLQLTFFINKWFSVMLIFCVRIKNNWKGRCHCEGMNQSKSFCWFNMNKGPKQDFVKGQRCKV